MKNRARQRDNRRAKHREESIERRNAFGVKDLTPYNAVRQIQTGGRADIELGTPQGYFYTLPTKRKKQAVPRGGFSMPKITKGGAEV